MRVLFDHQIFSWQDFGGISRYFCELFGYFNEIDVINSTIFSNNSYLAEKKYFKYFKFFPGFNFKGKQYLMNTINEKSSIYFLKKSNYDVLHPTYYNPYFIDYAKSKPIVLTVHDMTHERVSNLFGQNDQASLLKRECIKRADKIIAVSENTKNDIIDILNVPEGKIDVIYHGINQNIFFDISDSKIFNFPYILFIGDRDNGYKNFHRFIKAFAELAQSSSELKLVCSGNKFNKKELDLFKTLGIYKNVIHFYASEALLSKLYRDAILFIYPSLYEGFGFPILEAFKNGCPVVLSKASCFSEIALYAGEYFDPYDINSILNALKSVVFSSIRQADLKQKGYKRMKNFTWEESSAKTLEIYSSLV
jgi:glycosyltransferase involved in cell wall biosynthesis